MKKLIAVLVIALVVAAAVWIAVRVQLAKRVAAVPTLLPQTTLILVELPDPAQARADWHESDLYKIWHEPAVQEFLQKPLARVPKDRGGRQTLAEFLALGPKNSFLALTSLEKNEPKLIGGFHFDASPEKAREFIGPAGSGVVREEREARNDRLRAAPDRDGGGIALCFRERLRQPVVFRLERRRRASDAARSGRSSGRESGRVAPGKGRFRRRRETSAERLCRDDLRRSAAVCGKDSCRSSR